MLVRSYCWSSNTFSLTTSLRPNQPINSIGSILSIHPIYILAWLKGIKSAMQGIGGQTFRLLWTASPRPLSPYSHSFQHKSWMLHSTNIRLHHNLITQTDVESKLPRFGCLNKSDPFPSPPYHQTSQTERVARWKRMDRCIAKALPNQTIFTISSFLVILSFLVMCCFHSSAHSPLTCEARHRREIDIWRKNSLLFHDLRIYILFMWICHLTRLTYQPSHNHSHCIPSLSDTHTLRAPFFPSPFMKKLAD
jgi:hypothetical protein